VSTTDPSALTEGERRFLAAIRRKYSAPTPLSLLRSYALAAFVLLALFALARYVPLAPLALAAVELFGLLLFHQYKRFARFKSRVLKKLWDLQASQDAPPLAPSAAAPRGE
jgi:hypothetical protein